MIASGTVTRITMGWMKLSNCAASTRYTISSAKRERDPQRVARLLELVRFAVVDDLRRRRFFANHLLHVFDRVTERIARRQRAGELDGAHAVGAPQFGRAGAFFDVHQRGQRNQLAVLVGTHVEVVEVADRGALRIARLQHHVVLLARRVRTW